MSILRNIKRTIATIMTCTMGLTLLSPSITSYAEGYDTTAPQVTSFSIDGSSYNVGDTVTFTMGIIEEETGVASCQILLHNLTSGQTKSVTPDGIIDNFTGTYNGYLAVTEDMDPGTWEMTMIIMKDNNNNETNAGEYNLTTNYRFEVINESITDITAPFVSSVSVEYDEINSDNFEQIVNVYSDDEDIDTITVYCRYSKSMTEFISNTITVSEVSSVYPVSITHDDTNTCGTWLVDNVVITDINGNSAKYLFNESYNVTTSSEEQEKEVTTINSVNFENSSVVIPAYNNCMVYGTSTADSVNVLATIVNPESHEVLNGNANVDVIDGEYNASVEFTLDSTVTCGTWYVNYISVNDTVVMYSSSEYPASFEATNELEDLYIHTSNNNSNLVEVIDNAPENSTILVNTNGNYTVSADVFSSIKDTNKTVIFDLDGIKWEFNGNNINDENIKDINISTSVEDVNLTEYGYDDNANGVALVFQPNGILPCTSKIYIKDDYVSNKFNLSGNMYLGFVKSSADNEEELSFTESDIDEDIEVEDEDSDVEDDEIEYVKENDIIVIEDSIISYENGYVTITMTHNSSYILSDSLPVIKTNVEDISDNDDALPLPSPEANNGTADTNIIIYEAKVVPSNVELKETEIDEVAKKETVVTNNIKIKDNTKEEVVSKTIKNNKKSYSFIKFRMVVENFFSFINQKMHNLIVILLSIFK